MAAECCGSGQVGEATRVGKMALRFVSQCRGSVGRPYVSREQSWMEGRVEGGGGGEYVLEVKPRPCDVRLGQGTAARGILLEDKHCVGLPNGTVVGW